MMPRLRLARPVRVRVRVRASLDRSRRVEAKQRESRKKKILRRGMMTMIMMLLVAPRLGRQEKRLRRGRNSQGQIPGDPLDKARINPPFLLAILAISWSLSCHYRIRKQEYLVLIVICIQQSQQNSRAYDKRRTEFRNPSPSWQQLHRMCE